MGGKALFPLWSQAYFQWRLLDPRGGGRDLLVVAYRGDKPVGCVMGGQSATLAPADGKIYVINFSGQVTILDAGDGKIINTVAMDEEGTVLNRASIVAAHSQLFIRAGTELFCIAAETSE